MATIEKLGGKAHHMYVLLGDYDVALIVDFPGPSEAVTASVALADLTGVAFTTLPAITVDEFDALLGRGAKEGEG